ncbi:MAG: hypothetical protein IPJ56_17635 [Gemmatimonadetes bacterium]|nr:hypothetical protein [Gemmatimonadota bacterium]
MAHLPPAGGTVRRDGVVIAYAPGGSAGEAAGGDHLEREREVPAAWKASRKG